MLYEVTLLLEIDPDVYFLGADPASDLECVREAIVVALYDMDDTEVIDIDVRKYDDK